ncbi:family 20 glycosylhydrolase [Staphylococcus massiliensis]|uniref:family 20 glycosylhydrolase n=2 Tax=Staphylococcus massiliensis TaxID=555791 RepID=UPI001EE0DCAF|nr:hypothetical protein [Staphylococcus massiliensis]MCG3400406.1 hypothetical protein [Staphylococcus massiliensis]
MTLEWLIFFDDEKALSHVKALQNEVQEMFKQPKFEGQQRIVLGGDEVPGSGSNQKAFVNFMNQLGSNATQKGYKPQMWNDSLRAEGLKSLDKSFSILHWKQGSYGKADPGPTAKEFTDAGFALYNYNMMTSYFLPGPEYRNKDMGAIAKEFFEKFDYHTFYENGRSNNQVEDANVKGGAMSFWCEKTGNMHEDDIYKQQHPIITSYLNAAKNED